MPTANDLLDAALAAIAEHNARTNAFILVDEQGARAAARAVDDERRRGVDRGPLHGLPISIKDLVDVAGQPTTAASRVRAGHVAARDATIVTRLRDAGAVLIGKTNLHEFALGTTSEESAFGPVRNPHDTSRSAGGSSGGSAVAVATGMGMASIGTDTGGSIRIPAAACGIVGLKPSLGEVPTDGVVPLSATLDHVGPLARSVDDAATLWAVLASRPMPSQDRRDPRSLTLGAPAGYFTALLTPEVRTAYENALQRLRALGVNIEPRTVQGTESIVEAYTSISLPEAAHWHTPTLDSRARDYQPPVRERLERGRTIAAISYLRARDTRELLRRAVDTALEGCDALVLPTLPIVAPPIGAADVAMDNGETIAVRAAMLRLTQLFNVTGHPAISLPISSDGLPVGLQLVGRRDETERLLSSALVCERSMMQ
ncbi:MAG TPA: amidase [Gemmatimonadaceae bacterium]|jgi:aspartyl-tRNA(Asn)/glutamyl-tRNA(Gln) amidotransferase subunit A|nr:amidase [Gemmatimonadaceae bacterium]